MFNSKGFNSEIMSNQRSELQSFFKMSTKWDRLYQPIIWIGIKSFKNLD